MNFIIRIVLNAVASSVAKTKRGVSKQEIQRRKVALTKIALVTGNGTKKSIAAALRADQLPGTPINVENIQKIRTAIDSVRCNRILHHAKERGCSISSLPVPNGRLPITLPKGKLLQRLNERRREEFKRYALRLIKNGAPGGSSFEVRFASVTNEVNYSTSLGSTYDVYRGAFKGWRANVDNHNICIPHDWRVRVQRKGIASLGGMLTLDALRLEAPIGIVLYAAVWVTQGRGYALSIERGFIATQGNEHFHADTAENAILGIQAKGRAVAAMRTTTTEMNMSINKFSEKYSKFAVDVSLADARNSGSCEYGIRSWCSSVGIDISRVHVPMVELLEAFRKMPLPEVRRTVLHAVRKNRVVSPS